MAIAEQIEVNGEVRDVADAFARDAITVDVEDYFIAQSAHAAGSYFAFGDAFCIATVDIAVGDTITVGINCRVTSIGEALGDRPKGVVLYTLTLGTGWSGNASPYTQSVSFSGYTPTANTKVDLSSDVSVINKLLASKTRMIYVENNNGVLTAYAVGGKPTQSISVCAEVKET